MITEIHNYIIRNHDCLIIYTDEMKINELINIEIINLYIEVEHLTFLNSLINYTVVFNEIYNLIMTFNIAKEIDDSECSLIIFIDNQVCMKDAYTFIKQSAQYFLHQLLNEFHMIDQSIEIH